MTFDDIKIVWNKKVSPNRFGHWLMILNHSPSKTNKAARKEILEFFKQNIGPLGQKWQYQKIDESKFILKLDDERDLLFFVLKSR